MVGKTWSMDRSPYVLDTMTGSRTLDQVGTALDRTWCSHDHVPDTVRMQMAIAVGEISANIVEHAAQDGPVRLRMLLRVLPDQVHVCFVDGGRPAVVDIGQAAMPDHMAESGRGLALARAVLDRLHYERSFANHWTLVSRQFA